MGEGEAAQVGAGLEVDGHRALPRGVPVVVVGIVGDGFEHAGIVDQHVDPPPSSSSAASHRRAARRVGEVGGDQAVAARVEWPTTRWPGGAQMIKRRGADAAAGAGEEDVHGAASAA